MAHPATPPQTTITSKSVISPGTENPARPLRSQPKRWKSQAAHPGHRTPAVGRRFNALMAIKVTASVPLGVARSRSLRFSFALGSTSFFPIHLLPPERLYRNQLANSGVRAYSQSRALWGSRKKDSFGQ